MFISETPDHAETISLLRQFGVICKGCVLVTNPGEPLKRFRGVEPIFGSLETLPPVQTQEVFRKKDLSGCHRALNLRSEDLLRAAALQSHHLAISNG